MRRVVEALVLQRRRLGEPRLHLVADGQRGKEVLPGRSSELCRGEGRAQVVRGVKALPRDHGDVHEVEVTHQRGVPERRPIGRGPAASNGRALGAPAQLRRQLPDRDDRLTVERRDGAAKGVEHQGLEVRHLVGREVRELARGRPLGDVLALLRLGRLVRSAVHLNTQRPSYLWSSG